MPGPGKIAREVEEIDKAIAALRTRLPKVPPDAARQMEFHLQNAARDAKQAAAAELAGKLEDAEVFIEAARDNHGEAHNVYDAAKGAKVEPRKVVLGAPKTPPGTKGVLPPRMTGAPMPKIVQPGAGLTGEQAKEQAEDLAKKIDNVTRIISQMQTAIAARRKLPMTAEEEELIEQAEVLTSGAIEQFGDGNVDIALRVVNEASGRFARAIGLTPQAEIAASMLMPQAERIEWLNAARVERALADAELRAGRTEEALRHKRLEAEYMKIIEATYPLARLDRWLAEYRILHPRMRYVALAGERLVGFIRNWKFWAGMVTFALFIWEEASQAFGMRLSFGLSAIKDRASKVSTDPLDRTGMTDEEYQKWREETDLALSGYEAVADSMQWWVDYPGLYALIFRQPYVAYAGANWANIAQAKAILTDIEATRQAYRLGRPTPVGVKEASEANYAVKESFDAVSTLGFAMDRLNKQKSPSTGLPDVPGLSQTLEDLKGAESRAEAHLNDTRRTLQRSTVDLVRPWENAKIGNQVMIREWERQIKRYVEGEPDVEEGATLGESLRSGK